MYQFNLSFSLSLLLMGFLLANIFGILTNNKNIIFFFVLLIETINYLAYDSTFLKNFFPKNKENYRNFTKSNKQQTFLRKSIRQLDFGFLGKKNNKISIFITTLNFLKIGLEFGFFIDAFKLGS